MSVLISTGQKNIFLFNGKHEEMWRISKLRYERLLLPNPTPCKLSTCSTHNSFIRCIKVHCSVDTLCSAKQPSLSAQLIVADAVLLLLPYTLYFQSLHSRCQAYRWRYQESAISTYGNLARCSCLNSM